MDKPTVPMDDEFTELLLRITEAHRSVFTGGRSTSLHHTVEEAIAREAATRKELEAAHDMADELQEFRVEEFNFQSRHMESVRRVLDGIAFEEFDKLVEEDRMIEFERYDI